MWITKKKKKITNPSSPSRPVTVPHITNGHRSSRPVGTWKCLRNSQLVPTWSSFRTPNHMTLFISLVHCQSTFCPHTITMNSPRTSCPARLRIGIENNGWWVATTIHHHHHHQQQHQHHWQDERDETRQVFFFKFLSLIIIVYRHYARRNAPQLSQRFWTQWTISRNDHDDGQCRRPWSHLNTHSMRYVFYHRLLFPNPVQLPTVSQ
jgi:hypothetical protein